MFFYDNTFLSYYSSIFCYWRNYSGSMISASCTMCYSECVGQCLYKCVKMYRCISQLLYRCLTCGWQVMQADEQFGLVMVAERMEESLVLLAKYLCWNLSDVLVLRLNSLRSEVSPKGKGRRKVEHIFLSVSCFTISFLHPLFLLPFYRWLLYHSYFNLTPLQHVSPSGDFPSSLSLVPPHSSRATSARRRSRCYSRSSLLTTSCTITSARVLISKWKPSGGEEWARRWPGCGIWWCCLLKLVTSSRRMPRISKGCRDRGLIGWVCSAAA